MSGEKMLRVITALLSNRGLDPITLSEQQVFIPRPQVLQLYISISMVLANPNSSAPSFFFFFLPQDLGQEKKKEQHIFGFKIKSRKEKKKGRWCLKHFVFHPLGKKWIFKWSESELFHSPLRNKAPSTSDATLQRIPAGSRHSCERIDVSICICSIHFMTCVLMFLSTSTNENTLLMS